MSKVFNGPFYMKLSNLCILAAALAFCGCAHSSNGQLQVNLRRPAGMESRPARIYFNDHLAYKTTDQSVTASLLPMKQTIRVEMDGAKSLTQAVRVASGGKEAVSFNLERE
jgi:hypothetical protein